MKALKLFLSIVLVLPCLSKAQIDGDNIFGTDQVVSIYLSFPQENFWNELTSNYEAEDNLYIVADLMLADLTGTYEMDSVGVRLKGNSSYNHPGDKKSFKIDFNKFITGQNYDGLKKLNFSNGFKDPAVIREKVFFDVCREAGIAAPRASFAEVYFNGEPWGFYTIIEQIDDQFLDWNIQEDDGNLFKAGDNFGGPGGGGDEAADLAYYGSAQANYSERYELKTNEDLDDWTDLVEFIDFVDNTSTAEFEEGIGDRLELTEYLRSAALDNLFSNLDSYTGSARNYYIYHNQMTDKWEWIKWDGNEAFGSYTNQAGNMLTLDVDYHDNPRPLLDKVMESEVLYSQYLTELCYLTDNFFNSTYMDNRIDEVKVLVQDYVYADANKMYSNTDFDTNIESNINTGGGMGGGTVYGLKYFVAERASNVGAQVDCSLYTGQSELDVPLFEIYPNPVTNRLNINSLDGNLVKVVVRDVQGAELMTQELNQVQVVEVDVKNLSTGMYTLELINEDNHSALRPFIKQ